MFSSRIIIYSVTSVTHSVNFAICSNASIIFIVEMETVQFDTLLLLHSPNVKHNLK